MAAIGKIREKSGLLLVIIGLALAAFVLGDLFKNLGRGSNVDPSKLAVINGEKVGAQYFSMKVNKEVDMLVQSKNRNLTNEETYSTTITIWNNLKKETIFRQQMQKLGLVLPMGDNLIPEMSMEEFMSNISGPNPNREVINWFSRYFQGQQVGKDQVKQLFEFIERGKQSDNAEERQQAVQIENDWNYFKGYLKPYLLENKYNSLITKAYYLPKALAEREFEDNNKLNNVSYFAVLYSTIKDEDAEATDADYEAYYAKHQKKYEAKEPTRKIEYIQWVVRPSNGDIVDLQKQIQGYYKDLTEAKPENIPYMVNRVGDNHYDSTWINKGVLSVMIDSVAFAAEIGTVLGPWTENSAYHIARIMGKDIRPDSMKASQIFITYAGAQGAGETITRTKIGARALADSIKEVLSADISQFDTLVYKSDDPSAVTNKGDLGWFTEGVMDEKKTVMNPDIINVCIKGNIGDVEVLEMPSGYMVLKVDDKTEPKEKIRIAQIDLPITFSQETFKSVYGTAIKFAATNQTYEAFDTSSASSGLNVIKGNFINEMTAGIGGLKNSRDVVKWMFNEETKVGTVSKVFDFEDRVVVAVLTEIRPKGVLPLDDKLKEELKPLVVREVKARLLKEKLAGVKSLEQAKEFDSKVETSTVSFASANLRGYGPEPDVVGRMQIAAVNTFMGPIQGDQGMYFFKVIEEGKIPEKKDVAMIQQQSAGVFLRSVFGSRNQSNPYARSISSYTPLEDNADIENNMFFFY